MRLGFRFLLMVVFCLSGGWQAACAEWSSRLEAGGTVSVDPTTNRATVTRDGVSTQLWDGVHVLEDGSTVTVRSGQVVPNEAILRAREPQPPVYDPAQAWVGVPIAGQSPCEQLVQRVCGDNDQCSEVPACGLARQLLEMENEDRAKSEDPRGMTYSSGQCKEADKDRAYFQLCTP
ncbi:MAG: hypothetical protein PVJ83_07230 [Gammaproteobacteria bacterium]|jgi:hypothetical protein